MLFRCILNYRYVRYLMAILVKDLMSKQVVAVHPNDSVVYAANLLTEKRLNGLPVTADDGSILGIVTEYDLITKGSSIHLPTFIKLVKGFPLYKKDRSLISDEIKKIISLRVSDVLNPEPVVVHPETTAEDAARVFSEHHRVNPLLVADQEGRLVGVLSRYDIIKLYTGSKAGTFASHEHYRSADREINEFLRGFERQFVVVSKFRTQLWFVVGLLFVFLGAALVLALLLRIDIR